MFIINMAQLATILDASKFALYATQKGLKDKAGRDEYQIDIDSFLIAHKVNHLPFEFETKDKSFSDRLQVYNYPDYIDASEAKKILQLENYEFRKLRLANEIISKKTGAKTYVYETNSILKKAIEMGIQITVSNNYKYTKQFYTPHEAIEKLEENRIRMSLKTFYRYIYQYKKIPCIKVSGMLRIPIIEFNNNVIPNASDIFRTII